MTFGEKLKLLETRKKTALSLMAGLPRNAISLYICRPRICPSADVAFRIARVLGVDVGWLINDGEDWPPMRVVRRQVVEEFSAAVA